jgi:hypothetical protein
LAEKSRVTGVAACCRRRQRSREGRRVDRGDLLELLRAGRADEPSIAGRALDGRDEQRERLAERDGLRGRRLLIEDPPLIVNVLPSAPVTVFVVATPPATELLRRPSIVSATTITNR